MISYLSQEDNSDKGLVKNCCISKLFFASQYESKHYGIQPLVFPFWWHLRYYCKKNSKTVTDFQNETAKTTREIVDNYLDSQRRLSIQCSSRGHHLQRTDGEAGSYVWRLCSLGGGWDCCLGKLQTSMQEACLQWPNRYNKHMRRN